MKSKNNCPICKEKPIMICMCDREDSQCRNGHWWHTCVIHDKIVLGESDHSIDTNACTCKK